MESHLFEALTEAGIAPDAARQVERSIKAAIQAGQQVTRAGLREPLMTKADGMSLRAELKADTALLKADLKADLAGFRGDFYKALNEQTWKVTSSVVVANTLLVVLFKCLP